MVTGDGENRTLDLFLGIGLDKRTAENSIVNSKVTANLTAVIKEAGVVDGCSKSVGNLLYMVATKFPANALIHRRTLLEYVVSLKIKNTAQLDEALKFLSNIGPENFQLSEFEKACGVGVDVSVEEIVSSVSLVLQENMKTIMEQRYRINVGNLCGQVRKLQPWSDAKIVKEIIDQKLYELLGERTAADNEKPTKKKKEKATKVETVKIASASPAVEEVNPYLIFPQPDENVKVHTEIFFSDGTIWAIHNSKEKLDKHLAKTGGKVYTRFPPEPNGYLHIGHAKAMFIDFGLAKERNGGCYLRFDDTNPEAEKQEYIDHIHEIVSWMGWEPFKVTYTSDYFQDLYDLALKLIRKGLAYVDHQTPDEIKEYRENKMNSPWRDRSISESLKMFEEMRRGMIDEGKATLRLKQDMQSDNKNMYDLIAYRIKFTPHPATLSLPPPLYSSFQNPRFLHQMASPMGISSLYHSPTQSSLLPTEIATTSQFFGGALKTTAVCLRTTVKPPSSSLFVVSASIVTPNSVVSEGALKRSDGLLEAVGVDFDREREEDVLAIANLGLPQALVDSLLKRGITQLFPIQRAVLVPALEGRDIIARAKTGTGKTLAFGIPIIKRITIDHEKTNIARRFGRLPRFLVLAPTRELARQVEKEIKDSAPYLNTVCVYGGVSYTVQQNALSRGVDVVVGTPGRIIDLVNGRSLKLSEVQYLVLDEADQMLAVGFEEDVELILENLPAERQSMLFSATMPVWVKKLARKYLADPLTIDLVGNQDEKLAEGIKLYAIPTTSTSKRTILSDLVTVYGKGGKTIVFTQTKRDADEVSLALTSSIASEALHGDISQHQRERTLNGFRQGKFTVLVATDVAARGLDIPNVDLIIHYELPNGPETFVHRSGRTGRAGKEGRAIVMFTRNQRRTLRSLERDVGCRFEFISPPQIHEILESSAEQVIATLQGVHPESIQYFLPTAQKLIKEKGNDAFAAALAHLSGFSQPPLSRSLISHEKGWVTLQLKRDPGFSRGYFSARNIMGFLADVYPPAADSVGKILIIADLMIQGAVFDLPEEIAKELLNQQIPPGNTISKISKLPELQDDGSRNDNYGRFSNSDRGSRYGFRGGSSRNYSGRGSRGRSSRYSDDEDGYRRGGRSGRYSDDEDSRRRGGHNSFRSDNWARSSSRESNDWLIGGNRRPIRSPSSGNRERSFAGACFNCGRSGHRASDCPNKREY